MTTDAERLLAAHCECGAIRSWSIADYSTNTYRITCLDGQDFILDAESIAPYLSGLTRGYATAHHLTEGTS